MKPTNLVPCRTCAEPISRDAAKCPYCAELLPIAERRDYFRRIALLVLLALVFGLVAWAQFEANEKARQSQVEQLNAERTLDAQVRKWDTAAAQTKR